MQPHYPGGGRAARAARPPWSRSGAGQSFRDFSELLAALRGRLPPAGRSRTTLSRPWPRASAAFLSRPRITIFFLELPLEEGSGGADFLWGAPPAALACRDMAEWRWRRHGLQGLAGFLLWALAQPRTAGVRTVWSGIDIRKHAGGTAGGLTKYTWG